MATLFLAAGAVALTTTRVSVARAAASKMGADDAAAPTMPYRLLGNTGLAVSVLSYGTWATYGAKDDLMGKGGVDRCKECFRVARGAGVNLFDNAETYGVPVGAAEKIMGTAIKELQAEDPELWRRSDLVLTTKIFWGGGGINERGLQAPERGSGSLSGAPSARLRRPRLLPPPGPVHADRDRGTRHDGPRAQRQGHRLGHE